MGVTPTGSGFRPSDRAADGVSPLRASIPNAAFRCVHCGHAECVPHVFTGLMKGVPMVDCAACGEMHSPPDPNSPRSLRAVVARLTAALEGIEAFGYDNSGYGFSCARKASVALGKEPR